LFNTVANHLSEEETLTLRTLKHWFLWKLSL